LKRRKEERRGEERSEKQEQALDESGYEQMSFSCARGSSIV
jgi:hypothetical protein